MTGMAERFARLSAEQRATLADRLAESADTVASEPIAVVGLGCRFPGGATGPNAYWRLLTEGTDAVTDVPADRWDAEAHYDPDPDAPGKINSRRGAFLDDPAGFDAEYFGLTPREAAAMDPQQRLLLEVVVEALEDARLGTQSVRGSRTGLFTGVYYHDYQHLNTDPAAIDAYTSTGNAHSVTAGRVSYQLDLRGPAVAVDTACSSSLVALHLACQSLRLRDCDTALAAGVSLMLASETSISLARWGMLSPRGQCRAFDAGADGFVRGEGCGVVVLKRLGDALRDGDDVLAVVRGSAVNSDGQSQGLTAPSGTAQQRVIADAVTRAGVDATQLGLVETHGTGTSLGDPIEFEALTENYGTGADRCALGAVKTNLGHLEAAAGVAGFIKAVLAVRAGVVPANLHFTEWNPNLRPDDTRFFVPTATEEWPVRTGARVAAVSSFGFGGTNAHLILEQAGAPDTTQRAEPRRWNHTRHWLETASPCPGTAAEPGRDGGVPAEWITRPVWRRSTVPTQPAVADRWVVVGSDVAHREAVAQSLSASGATVTTAAPGEIGDRIASVDRVAYLAAPTGGADPAADAHRLAGELLAVLGELRTSQDPPRLHLLTRLAVSVHGEQPDPAQATLWGWARGIAIEYPQAWGSAADTDAPERAAEVLLAEAGADDGEDQVVYRSGVRHLPRLERSVLGESGTSLAGEGTQLVVGANGAIGTELVQELARLGARHFTLVSRRGVTGPLADTVDRLRAEGGTVVDVVADAADPVAMAEVFDRFGGDLPALSGVFLAAFAGGMVPLAELDEADVRAMFRAKVDAAGLLDRLSRDHAVRHFVLFSSTTGVFGSRKLAHYSAASAFLDGLAHARRAAGQPAVAIDWGIWAGRLSLTDEDSQQYVTSSGLRPMDDALAIRALAPLLTGDAPVRTVVAAADWSLLADAYGSRTALKVVAELVPGQRAEDEAEFLAALRGHDRSEWADLVAEHVRAVAAEVMRFPAPQALDSGKGFFELGMDSLMSVQLQRRLSRTLGLPLTPTVAFNHPSVDELTRHVLSLLSDEPVESGRAPAPVAGAARPDEPVAVVGLGCRFPGGAENVDDYWRLLVEGVDGIVDVPAGRWDADAFHSADHTAPGTISSRRGGFLTGWQPDQFDAEFFGLSPREAEATDPQQRLLLELAVEALAHAGTHAQSLRNTRTGVYIGITTHDYLLAQAQHTQPEDIDAYTTTGNAANFAAGRISYLLGLQGPSMAVDTACSSGLTAVHLGIQALRTGEADAVLTGGVNLMLTPEPSISFSRWGMLSPQGRCKTFDASADGFVRGEGGGVLLLKRLSDAERDGDRILAVVRGSAANQDGPSSGQTVPNGVAQEAVIREALRRSGLEPDDIDYVETHGAATTLGDPIELEALGSVFGEERERRLVVGSVKTNFGHLEAAAGVAGLIKTVLSLHHGEIPPHLHLSELTHRVSPRGARVSIPGRALPWPAPERPARAGVSAFGASGTNIHLVVEQATGTATENTGRGGVWMFSGQGSQWAGMGQRLLTEEPAFAKAVEELEPAFLSETGISLRDTISSGKEIRDIDTVQPVLFGMQVALAALWRSHGVHPDAVIGHSMGEAAAAVVAGALTAEDGLKVIGRRSRLLRTIAGRGAMAVLELSGDEAAEFVAELPGVEVAVYAAPRQTVVAGDSEQVRALVERLTAKELFARLVKVDVASHSPQVDPLLDALVAELTDLRPRTPEVTFYSTVTDGTPRFDAAYWADNLRRPVRFAPAVSAALADGHRTFVEISPHPLLTTSVTETAGQTTVAVHGSLHRDSHEFRPRLSTELPPPEWHRTSHWFSRPPRREAGHPFLGSRVALPDGRHAFSAEVGTETLPWLADHQVHGTTVMPAAGLVEMVLAALSTIHDVPVSRVRITRLDLDKLLPLHEASRLTTLVSPHGEHRATVEVYTTSDAGAWVRHATARTEVVAEPPAAPALAPDQEDQGTPLPASELYARLRSVGQQHGPAFAAVTEAWVAPDGRVTGTVHLPPTAAAHARDLRVHPVLLDGALQLLGATPDAARAGEGGEGSVVLPTGFGAVSVFGDVRAAVTATAVVEPSDEPERFSCAVRLADAEGTVLVEAAGIEVVRLETAARTSAEENIFFETGWDATPLEATPTTDPGRWIVLTEHPEDGGETDPALEALRTACGAEIVDAADGQALSTALATPARGVVLLAPTAARDTALDASEGLDLAQRRAMRAVETARTMVSADLRDLPRLYLVTRGGQRVRADEPVTLPQASLRAVARVLGYEHRELRATLLDLGREEGDRAALPAELLAGPADDEVALRDGVRYVARLAAAPAPGGYVDREVDAEREAFGLVSTEPGVLDSLRLRRTERPAPDPGYVEIRVRAAGLNFSDVLKAYGTYPTTSGEAPVLGGECVGVVTALGEGVDGLAVGDQVLALASGSFGSHTVTPAELVAPVPQGLTAGQAATLPVAYATAWYALHHIARIQRGQRVLIHAATGGVGLAAVSLARAVGAEVHATAGSAAKRDYLRELGVEHVYDSRDLAAFDEIQDRVGSVDVVLNSLTGEALRRGVELLAPGGHFVELGKKDTYGNTPLDLGLLAQGSSFSTVDLDGMLRLRPALGRCLLDEVLTEIAEGRLRPLPHREFGLDQAREAFSLMARAEHIGKVVLTVPDSGPITAQAPAALTARPDGGYLVTGGLRGLGLVTGRWLAERGAGMVVLNGRSQPDQEALDAIAAMRAEGTRVEVVTGDIAAPDTAQRLVSAVEDAGYQLRGVLHSAAVLADETVLRLTPHALDQVFAPKVAGGWRLHEACAGRALDFFVAYSSAASLVGSPGQAAYAAANGWLDGLMAHRRASGLPGLAVNWGPWGEIGQATDFAARGYRVLAPRTGLDALSALVGGERGQAGVFAFDARQWFQAFPAVASSSYFAGLTGVREESGAAHGPARSELAELPVEQRKSRFESYLAGEVRAVLRLGQRPLDPETPFATLGLDSLMALELRNRLEAGLGVTLPATLVWSCPTVRSLAEELASRLGLDLGAPEPEPADGISAEDVELLNEITAGLLDGGAEGVQP